MINQQTPTKDVLKMNLSVAERLQLVEDLWDSIVADADQLSLSDYQKKYLDEELEDYKKSPDSGSTWDEVKSDIKKIHAQIHHKA